MTRTNLPAADTAQICQFNTTLISDLQAKLNEHDSALDAIGAPSVGAATETKTSGALTVTTPFSRLSVTGTVAFTLADGTVDGQTKVLECTVAATSPKGTLTIATPAGTEPATHVFNAVGQRLTLQWNASGWHIIGKHRAGSVTAVVGTTVLTGFDMNAVYDLSITGTVESSTTMALPDPTVGDTGQMITITCSTAATCPAGTLDGTFLDHTNAAKTKLAVNATTDSAVLVASVGKWREVLLNSTSFS